MPRSLTGPRPLVHFALVATALSIALVAGYKANPLAAPPTQPARPTKKVFAHYMVCCDAAGGGVTIDDFKKEIQEAQKRGIDGFALNSGAGISESPSTKSEPARCMRPLANWARVFR